MRTNKQIIEQMNKRNLEIIALCAKGPLKVADICKAMNVDRSVVGYNIIKLREDGYIACEGARNAIYRATGKEYVPLLGRAESKWARRKSIMEFCVDNPCSVSKLAERHKVSPNVVKIDIYHLIDMEIMAVDREYDSKTQAPTTYKTVQIKNVKSESVIRSSQFIGLTDHLKRMMGVNESIPTGGKVYKNMDKQCPVTPLRKMNYAWQGYQSGLEAA
jgi:transcription initiation factor IIE alpha subunit